MRKPPFELFHKFKDIFDDVNRKAGLKQQIIPYFISSHPGSTEMDMAELAAETKKLDFKLEQVQDFTPTPMTVSTEIYYTGYHPYTLEKVYCAHSPKEKLQQRQFFFWYQKENVPQLQQELLKYGRQDLIQVLFGGIPRYETRQHDRFHSGNCDSKSRKDNNGRREHGRPNKNRKK